MIMYGCIVLIIRMCYLFSLMMIERKFCGVLDFVYSVYYEIENLRFIYVFEWLLRFVFFGVEIVSMMCFM